MNLHEYQSKALMKAAGLPVLDGFLCITPEEVEFAARRLGAGKCIIKAQVHAGGRGKAGGVKVAENPAEAREAGEKILGMRLVSRQTGPEGRTVRKVYVEEDCDISREIYLSLLVDRGKQALCIVASPEGGMDIEDVARDHPEKIFKVWIDPATGFKESQALSLSSMIGIADVNTGEFISLLSLLCGMFHRYDLSLVEINPLGVTDNGNLIVLDAKCSVDDNAMFRQSELHEMMDADESDPKEIEAEEVGLNYIALDGNIGCMVNGAGLAMATMDIIRLCGGNPANFLDVGGGASTEMVTHGFRILLSDTRVKAILVNIFGGILRCDVLAQGIVDAVKGLEMKIPLVVRLQGTNVDQGRKILSESGLKIIAAETMADAAVQVVKAAAERQGG